MLQHRILKKAHSPKSVGMKETQPNSSRLWSSSYQFHGCNRSKAFFGSGSTSAFGSQVLDDWKTMKTQIGLNSHELVASKYSVLKPVCQLWSLLFLG